MAAKKRQNRNRFIPEAKTLQTVVIDIESLTSSGDGLGRLDNLAIFVPYTMPGDKAKVSIQKRKKSWAKANLVELIEPSPNRIEPPCEYFTQCGGCNWQHIPYENQLAAKSTILKETLIRIGELANPELEPMVPSPNVFNYRNRIQGDIRSGKFHYKRKGVDGSIAIDQCAIADPSINDYLENSLGTDTENTQEQNGIPARVEIAVASGVTSVFPINDRQSTELGFRQVNTAVSDFLTKTILNLVEQSNSEYINDLYCGRGSWSIAIASALPARTVVGIDSLEENIDIATSESARLKLRNLKFKHSKVETTIPNMNLKNSLCIADPPRAGLDPSVISALCDASIPDLVYVSCHPATLARDLKSLIASGYKVKKIIPFDMFPQTAHLESLVHLGH